MEAPVAAETPAAEAEPVKSGNEKVIYFNPNRNAAPVASSPNLRVDDEDDDDDEETA